MLHNILAALVILLASFGAVMLLILFLLRLLRPKEAEAYELIIRLKTSDDMNYVKVSYAAERLRFFGEDKCTVVTVVCDGLTSAEIQSLQNAFKEYSYVRFVGLE